ncbi:MAG: hypothetical protein P0116_08650 [Candidatus Nitrosocosmicus sp.]|nr:hypothetical protein [Candidatus Nitrosocosmicus sp.]
MQLVSNFNIIIFLFRPYENNNSQKQEQKQKNSSCFNRIVVALALMMSTFVTISEVNATVFKQKERIVRKDG